LNVLNRAARHPSINARLKSRKQAEQSRFALRGNDLSA
jgi:hypothetical protein